MRITGGKYRNRRIKCPVGIIRPAMDRMRESMFSVLGNIVNFSFLDLFSGSGIVGIEAASRGATPVILVEKDYIKKKTIMENISIVESEIIIRLFPVETFIKKSKDKFDIIFLDPPFPFKRKKEIVLQIAEKNILEKNGMLIVHHPSEEKWAENIDPFYIAKQKKFGRSILIFLKYR